MTDTENESASPDSVKRTMSCNRVAEYVLWDRDDLAYERSDSRAPCGTRIQQNGIWAGWEVCEECLKNPLVRQLLRIGAK